jgi:protein-histidine pros-kinase
MASPGNTIDGDVLEELGFQALVTKPIRQRALLESMAQVFGEFWIEQSEDFCLNDSTVAVNLTLGYDRPLNRLNVLVAEDNETNRMVITRILERFGAAVTAVENGREVLEALEAAPETFQAILMDCQMPVLDGRSATREIRRRGHELSHPVFSQIPIIAVTAHAMEGEKEQCLEAGMSDYLSKPFKPSDLVRVILKRTRYSPPVN